MSLIYLCVEINSIDNERYILDITIDAIYYIHSRIDNILNKTKV